jgi:hypothetical protein
MLLITSLKNHNITWKVFSFMSLIIICNKSFSQDTTLTSYFNEITSGTEYSTHKEKLKFNKDVYIIIQGECNQTLQDETIKIISELNDLIDPIEIYLTDEINIANVRLYFGGPDDYVKVNPLSESFLETSWGLFFLFPKYEEIDMSLVFVDVVRSENNIQRKHVLREELTQALGFGNDSFRYTDSIFYQGWTETQNYSELDKEVIKLMYN